MPFETINALMKITTKKKDRDRERGKKRGRTQRRLTTPFYPSMEVYLELPVRFSPPPGRCSAVPDTQHTNYGSD